MNKFEQVSRDGHQMSLALGVKARPRVPSLGEAQGACTVKSNALRVIVSWDRPCEQNGRQTRLETLPSRNFVGGR